jgi:hypothetical protein
VLAFCAGALAILGSVGADQTHCHYCADDNQAGCGHTQKGKQ